MKHLKQYLFILFLFGCLVNSFGQDPEAAWIDSMLTGTVENLNPVYKPVIGVGLGIMNFYGEIHNNVRNTTFGTPAYKVNIATFLDKKHYFKTNFTLLMGTISGDHRSLLDTALNLNFKSDIVAFGVNVHYDFKNFLVQSACRPFVSLGVENVHFNSLTDVIGKNNTRYHYWSDGTIRNLDEQQYKGTSGVEIIQRDYTYETDLRGTSDYSQNTIAIPLDIGIDYAITDRINLRIGHSWHFTFTDNIDNVSSKNTNGRVKGSSSNDMFTYSYFSVHFDLFSEARFIKYRKMFEEVKNYDYGMMDDEDNDLIPDGFDKCFGTPFGVPVDSIGCPLDTDKDGVYDYQDQEPNTLAGAIIDENGVTVNQEELAQKVNVDAINRRDVETFLLIHKAQSKGARKSNIPVPPKFKNIDSDGDKYISFEELLKAIDNFFDFSSELKTEDLYELQDFFFEQ